MEENNMNVINTDVQPTQDLVPTEPIGQPTYAEQTVPVEATTVEQPVSYEQATSAEVAPVMEQPAYAEQTASVEATTVEQPVSYEQATPAEVAPVMEQPAYAEQAIPVEATAVDQSIESQESAPLVDSISDTGASPAADTNISDNPEVSAQPVIKVSGTATEEEILNAANAKPIEVLDEDEMKKTITAANSTNKKNLIFLITIFALIIAFIFLMPKIISTIGF